MKEAVAGELATAYHSAIVDRVRANDYRHDCGRLTVHLAREFGFCYGVDRAVDYAYQARRRFPTRNVFLTGEIIHNPHVVSTSVQPWAESCAMSETVTPNAGRITTSSDPAEHREQLGSERNRMPAARSRSLTCGLWMISPVRNTLRVGKRRRA